MKSNSIKSFIQLFRSQQVKSQLHRGLAQMTVGTIIPLLVLGLIESVFYLSIPIRLKTAEFVILFFFAAIFYIGLRYYLNRNSISGNSSDYFLAHEFESREPRIGDRLINALQLEESLGKLDKGKDLAEYAVSRVSADLDKIPPESLYDSISNKLNKTLPKYI